jgi:hypothetical protein
MADKKKVISEDSNMMSNKWTSDASRREMKPTVLTIFDIVKSYDAMKGNEIKAPMVMPYPTQFLVQELGELYINATEVAQLIKQAADNPLIRDNKQSMEAAKKALLQTVNIRKSIKQIARHMDSAAIVKPRDDEDEQE